MKQFRNLLLLPAFLLAESCSTIRITSTWMPPDTTPMAFNKIAVVGIIREADRTLQAKMENHLADDLKALGYPAFSAYSIYGPKAFQNITEEEVNQKLKKEGVDAVLTIVLLDKQKERHYVPGNLVNTPYGMYYNRFWPYYHSLHYRIASPGYFTVSTNYFWESNLYDLSSEKLLFSVQTQSFDPASAEAQAHEYGKRIVETMMKKQVLREKNTPLAMAK